MTFSCCAHAARQLITPLSLALTSVMTSRVFCTLSPLWQNNRRKATAETRKCSNTGNTTSCCCESGSGSSRGRKTTRGGGGNSTHIVMRSTWYALCKGGSVRIRSQAACVVDVEENDRGNSSSSSGDVTTTALQFANSREQLLDFSSGFASLLCVYCVV